MTDDISDPLDARLTVNIPSKVKEEMRSLVKKGMFNSLSECMRTSIYRLLREINEYKEGEEKKHKEILKGGKGADMKELQKFVDELGEIYK